MESKDEMTLIEAIRKRPAMYIGSTSIRGFNNLLRELINDIFEEFEADYFSVELIEKLNGKIIFKNLQKMIADDIAVNFRRREIPTLRGWEFAALNALSKNLELRLFDENGCVLLKQIFERGKLKQGEIKNQIYNPESFEIAFDLDDSIFEISNALNANYFFEEIRDLAYLHKGKTLIVIYPFADEVCKAVLKFENGLKDKLEIEKLKSWTNTFLDTYIENRFDNFFVEIAFGFMQCNKPFLISFANYHYTYENGTHVEALLKGVSKAIKKYIATHQLADRFIISKKAIKETLVAAIQIKMERPQFYGATRYKLASPEIITPLTNHIAELLFTKMEEDPKAVENLLNKFRQFEW